MAKNLSTLIWCAFILMIVAVYISFLPDPDGVDIDDNLYMFSNKVATVYLNETNLEVDTTNSGLAKPVQDEGSFSGDNLTYGPWVQVPDEMVNKRAFTYTDYSMNVTESMGSKQGAAKIYWKKNNMIEHDEHGNCFIKYNNVRYMCVALPSKVCCADGTSFAESNGHTFLAKTESGEIIPMVMVDAKSDAHTVANDHWGQGGPDYCCYIESYMWGVSGNAGNPANNTTSWLHDDSETKKIKKVVAFCKGPDISGST